MKRLFDIVIVGGGMAGLALASALRDCDVQLALVEARELPQHPKPIDGLHGFDPRVSALTQGSADFFRQLGIWQDIMSSRNAMFDRMYVWDALGTANIEFNAAAVELEALGHIVENSVTLHALRQSLEDAKNLTVFCPSTLTGLRNSCDDGAVQEVDLDDGCTLCAKLIVAADGGNSQLRSLAGFDAREWSYDQTAIVASVKTAQPHENTAWQRFLPGGPLAFLPLAGEGDRCCSIVWSVDTAKAESVLALDDTQFRLALAKAFESRLGAIEDVSKRFSFPLTQRHAVDYVKPGIALIGDAAHVIHPLAGQGVNLGFKDVKVLSEEVQRTVNSGLSLGGELFLQRYQRRRKSDNLAMMAAVEGFKRLFGAQQLPLIWLRNAGMRQLNRIEPLKQQIVRQAMGL